MTTDADRHGRDGPQGWVFTLFIVFGAAQLIAAIFYFFASNWDQLSDLAKIALPQAAMALSFLGWAASPRPSKLGAVFGVAAAALIGISMATVGQVYQLGADPWRLFALWAAFALPLAAIARSDAIFALAFVVASAAYGLYTNERWPMFAAESGTGSALAGAVYAGLAFIVILIRESFAKPAPRWLRALLVFYVLSATAGGAFWEVVSVEHAPFEHGAWQSLVFLGAAACLFIFYRLRFSDAPAQALALFGPAMWLNALGVSAILHSADIKSIGAVSFVLFVCALWIIAVTGALAYALRRLKQTDAQS